jgi:hypothetical protein
MRTLKSIFALAVVAVIVGKWTKPLVFCNTMLALLHRLFQFFLMISQQSMNFSVRFVADSVNLRRKLLPRSVRILVEQRLNPVMVLLEAEAGLAAAVSESTPDLL